MTTARTSPRIPLWRVLLLVFAIPVLLVGSLYVIRAFLPESHQSKSGVEIQVGQVLPDFTLTALNGKSVKLSELPGKVHMINFWATWCDSCMEEMPSLVALRQAYFQRGFEILGVNLDENPSLAIPKTLKEFRIKFPVFTDPDNQISDLFDVHAIPLTVIINSERKILLIKNGGHEWNSPSTRTRLDEWIVE